MSDRFLQGRRALVTGSVQGIGLAMATELARAGAAVVLHGLPDAAVHAQACAAVAAAGGSPVRSLDHNLADPAAVDAMMDAVLADGALDILVNNAGIGISASVLDMSLADFQRQVAINVDGVFLGTKHSIPVMRLSGDGGSIINMSSVAGLKGSAILAGYCATKGAVRLFTKSVALECAQAKDGIRVNSVHPGIIETPIWDDIIGTGEPGDNARPPRPQTLDAMTTEAVPLGKKGWPIDIANGVLWLASNESAYVTGAELVIDGGFSIR